MSFEMHCMSTLSLFLGSIDARTWRGYRLYGPRMSPIDNFSLVTGSPTNLTLNDLDGPKTSITVFLNVNMLRMVRAAILYIMNITL